MLGLVYCSSLCVAHSQLLVLVSRVEAILLGCTEAKYSRDGKSVFFILIYDRCFEWFWPLTVAVWYLIHYSSHFLVSHGAESHSSDCLLALSDCKMQEQKWSGSVRTAELVLWKLNTTSFSFSTYLCDIATELKSNLILFSRCHVSEQTKTTEKEELKQVTQKQIQAHWGTKNWPVSEVTKGE